MNIYNDLRELELIAIAHHQAIVDLKECDQSDPASVNAALSISQAIGDVRDRTRRRINEQVEHALAKKHATADK